mmetsp:Transcript_15337/g.38876  ORF Transcript_15337/g.38876 Transcript_15337/m.38876 type:complete len:549 (-) Transcript_15337:26-1672(-)
MQSALLVAALLLAYAPDVAPDVAPDTATAEVGPRPTPTAPAPPTSGEAAVGPQPMPTTTPAPASGEVAAVGSKLTPLTLAPPASDELPRLTMPTTTSSSSLAGGAGLTDVSFGPTAAASRLAGGASDELLVVVGMVTPPDKRGRRQLIRDTMMNDPLQGHAIRFFFLHGINLQPAVSEAIRREMAEHGDGVMTTVVEGGRRTKQQDCAQKAQEFFVWGVRTHPRVPFFAKIEDDTLLFPARFVQELLPLLPIRRLSWSWQMWAVSDAFGGFLPDRPGEARDGKQASARQSVAHATKGRPGWNASAPVRLSTGALDLDVLVKRDPSPFPTGLIDVRSNELARDLLDCSYTRERGASLFKFGRTGFSCDQIHGWIIRMCAAQPWVIVNKRTQPVTTRTKILFQDVRKARKAVVMHPLKDYDKPLLWLKFWNESEAGEPFARSGALGATAYVATHSTLTGELKLREERIHELVANGPSQSLQPQTREGMLLAVKEYYMARYASNGSGPRNTTAPASAGGAVMKKLKVRPASPPTGQGKEKGSSRRLGSRYS